MNKKLPLIISGLIFLFMAIAHAGRLIWKVAITISGEPVPMSASLIGMVIALLLSIWMFMASKS